MLVTGLAGPELGRLDHLLPGQPEGEEDHDQRHRPCRRPGKGRQLSPAHVEPHPHPRAGRPCQRRQRQPQRFAAHEAGARDELHDVEVERDGQRARAENAQEHAADLARQRVQREQPARRHDQQRADDIDAAPPQMLEQDRRAQRPADAEHAHREEQEADALLALQQVVRLDRHDADQRGAAERFHRVEDGEHPRAPTRGGGQPDRRAGVGDQGRTEGIEPPRCGATRAAPQAHRRHAVSLSAECSGRRPAVQFDGWPGSTFFASPASSRGRRSSPRDSRC